MHKTKNQHITYIYIYFKVLYSDSISGELKLSLSLVLSGAHSIGSKDVITGEIESEI